MLCYITIHVIISFTFLHFVIQDFFEESVDMAVGVWSCHIVCSI